MMNKKYTHIFFDLDNTLWDFEKNSKNALFSTFSFYKLNSKIDFELFFQTYSKINHALWEDYRNSLVTKKELIRKRFQDTFDIMTIEGIDPEEMNNHYLGEMPKQKQLIDGVEEILCYLKQRNYQLYIITNGFKEVQHKKLEATGLKSYFSKIFISEEIKTPKPGREIFEYAIKSANAQKSASLMIGDDLEVDIKGALDFGIDAVYLKNAENPDLSAFEIQTRNKHYVISELNELKKIIK